MIALHILAGLLGIAAGATALAAFKGGRLHARSGLVFVGTLLVMTSSGAILAIVRNNSSSNLNAIAAALTFYLVLTGFLTIRGTALPNRWVDTGAALTALLIGLCSVSLGLQTSSQAAGPPAAVYFVFGGLALLAAVGDLRKLVQGVKGSRRVARHLWRMGAALWIATASFFLGQAKVFPEAVRNKPALLAIPVLLVLVTVIYWLVRVRLTPHHAHVRRFIVERRNVRQTTV